MASLVLIAAVDLVPGGLAGRAFGVAPAAAVGRLSDSLSIWHWPVIVLLPRVAEQRGWHPRLWNEPATLVAVTAAIASAEVDAAFASIGVEL